MIAQLTKRLDQFLPSKKILKNMSFLILGELVAKVLMFCLVIYLARSLNPEGYGQYSLAFNFAMGFLFLVDLGMNTILLRDGSKDNSELSDLINKAFTFKLYSGIITILIINIINVFILPYDVNQKMLIAVASVLVMLKELINVSNITFRAVEQMNYNSITRISEIVSFGIVLFIVSFTGLNPTKVLISWIISMISVLVLQYILSKKFIQSRFSLLLDWEFSWRITKQSFWLGVAALFASLYGNINILLISLMVGVSAVAFYTVAWQLVGLGTLIRGVISDAIFPNTCKRIYDKGYAQKFLKNITLVSILASAGALLVTLFAKYIIIIAFGYEYMPAIPVLQIMIWYVPLFIYNIWACQVMDSTNNQRYHFYNELFILLSTILLSYYLIYSYGIIGAAMATVLARVAGTIFLNIFAWKIITKLGV